MTVGFSLVDILSAEYGVPTLLLTDCTFVIIPVCDYTKTRDLP